MADLGLRALMHDDLQALMNEAVALVAQTLAVEYAKIVELLPRWGGVAAQGGGRLEGRTRRGS